MGIDSDQELGAVTDPAASAPVAVQTPPYVAALPAPAYPQTPVYAPAYEAPAPAPIAVAPRKGRPAWILPAAIAAAGLIASGSLGFLFYSTSTKLDTTQHQLTETQLKLDSTTKELATQKAQSAYVQMFENDMGRESTDFGTLVECDSYSSCRTATQDMLSDAQAFQSDRQSAKVPAVLTNVDSMLGDSLSAEISALKDLQSAIDGGNTQKIQSGFAEVNDATLSLFKTESALGKLTS